MRTLTVALLAAALALPVGAQDKKADAAKEQVRRLQQQQRKLEQEKSQLVGEKSALETRVKEAETRLDETQRKSEAAARRAATLVRDLKEAEVREADLRAEKGKLADQLAETEKRLTEISLRWRKEEEERKRLEALAAQQKQSIEQCEERNAKLYDQGVAILERYRSKGCFDAALQSEPFTGIKRVRIENFIEDSRDRLDESRLNPPARQVDSRR